MAGVVGQPHRAQGVVGAGAAVRLHRRVVAAVPSFLLGQAVAVAVRMPDPSSWARLGWAHWAPLALEVPVHRRQSCQQARASCVPSAP